MVTFYAVIVWSGCLLLGILLGLIRAYGMRLSQHKQEEQRELLRWERELEEKASEVRREKRLH